MTRAGSRGPTAQMARLLARLREGDADLQVEVDACSPRCRMPVEIQHGGHAARVRIRSAAGGAWLTTDRSTREERALLRLGDEGAETRERDHLEALAWACAEEAALRPPSPEAELLREIAERGDARHFAVGTRDTDGRTETARRTREELLDLLLERTWPTTAHRQGTAWALPVLVGQSARWLQLRAAGDATPRIGDRRAGWDRHDIAAVDALVRELLGRTRARPLGRWTSRANSYVVAARRSRRAHR